MKRLSILFVITSFFLSSQAIAITTNELLTKYGKNTVRDFILKASPDQSVTILYNGGLFIKHGRVSANYITTESVNNDFKRLGISPEQVEASIKEQKQKENDKQKDDLAWQQRNALEAKPEYDKKTIHKPEKTITGYGVVSQSTKNVSKSDLKRSLKEFAKRKYPNNTKMQDYIYRKQVTAYNYIITVKDSEIKEFSKRKYPHDYAMQKYIYDKQLSAKNYMSSVSDQNIKTKAVRKYPYDYFMQKYIYDKLAY